jgi:uncharacterized protein (DUF1800 family)
VGVRSGYSQADVTSLAKVITGWTWIRPDDPAHGGEFVFMRRLHEPGDQMVFGKRYADGGLDQGRAVLADLARHPATAQHISEKLARHFIADDPPPMLVTKLTKTFIATDGDLKEVAKILITLDESWAAPRTQLKPPAEWIVGVIRLTGAQAEIPIGRIMNAQVALGAPRGGGRRRTAIPMLKRHGSTAYRAASTSPQNLSVARHMPTHWRFSTADLAPSPRRKRGARSRMPKAAARP